MTTKKIAIAGDRFMLPQVFADKLVAACGEGHDIRLLELPWPDVPMEHGYAVEGMDGLKEYLGSPDEIVDFIGDAEIFVTQLAPLSRAMFARLPALRLVAVSRGGPVNIDMAAAREAGVTVVNTPGRNAGAVAEFTIGAILAETRLIRTGHESLRKGEWRGDLYRADRTGRELREMTVGVVGYGNIGTRVVRLLRAFGAKVLVHDPYVQLSAEDRNDGVELVALEDTERHRRQRFDRMLHLALDRALQADEVAGHRIIEDLAAAVRQQLVAKRPTRQHGVEMGTVAAFHQDGGALVDGKLTLLELADEAQLLLRELAERRQGP